jgi:hypothetical protein
VKFSSSRFGKKKKKTVIELLLTLYLPKGKEKVAQKNMWIKIKHKDPHQYQHGCNILYWNRLPLRPWGLEAWERESMNSPANHKQKITNKNKNSQTFCQ